MIYFDTDVLIHHLVYQEKEKHKIATKIFTKSLEKNTAIVSLLSLQEIAFVLSKLDFDNFEISDYINVFDSLHPPNYTLIEFQRAIDLAKKVGFSRFNDCLHLALAETYGKEFYTFNRKDFDELKNHTELKVVIL